MARRLNLKLTPVLPDFKAILEAETPKDTGLLSKSWTVTVSDNVIRAVNNQPYAAIINYGGDIPPVVGKLMGPVDFGQGPTFFTSRKGFHIEGQNYVASAIEKFFKGIRWKFK